MSVESDNNTPTLEVGMCFNDYDSLQDAIESYSMAHNYVYTIKTSRSIDVTNKHLPLNRKPYSKKLRKSQVTWACKHHGTFRRQSTGIRPNQRSYKTGCPSFLSVAVDTKTRLLVIKRFVKEHNHESGAEIAQCYPERRRLTAQETGLLEDHLFNENIKANILTKYVMSTTNKAITRKDIYNIRSKYRVQNSKGGGVKHDNDDSDPSSPQTYVKPEAMGEDDLGDEEYLEEDPEPYAIEVELEDGGLWEAGEVEEEVEVESEEVDHQRQMAEEVERVNEAWRCVYTVLEGENRRLKAEMTKMAEEMTAMKRRRVICHSCSKPIVPQTTAVHGTKPPRVVVPPRTPTQSSPGTINVRTKDGQIIRIQTKNSQVLSRSPVKISRVDDTPKTSSSVPELGPRLSLIPSNKLTTKQSEVLASLNLRLKPSDSTPDEPLDEVEEALAGLHRTKDKV